MFDVLQNRQLAPQELTHLRNEFWSEVCQQSWRMELDYGLPNAQGQASEHLLVLLSSTGAVKQLATVAELHYGSGKPGRDSKASEEGCVDHGFNSNYVIVQLEGWNLGAKQDQKNLDNWTQLQPKPIQPTLRSDVDT